MRRRNSSILARRGSSALISEFRSSILLTGEEAASVLTFPSTPEQAAHQPESYTDGKEATKHQKEASNYDAPRPRNSYHRISSIASEEGTTERESSSGGSSVTDVVGAAVAVDLEGALSTPICTQDVIVPLALQLGQAAYQYGAEEYKIENFIIQFLGMHCPHGCSICAEISNSHLTVSIISNFGCSAKPSTCGTTTTPTGSPSSSSYQLLPHTAMVPLVGGFNLHKLGALSDMLDDLLLLPGPPSSSSSSSSSSAFSSSCDHIIQITQNKFTALVAEPSLYSSGVRAMAYATTSAGVATLVQGSWTDVWVSFLGGGLAYLAVRIFDHYDALRQYRSTYGLMMASFGPAILVAALKTSQEARQLQLQQVNPVAVMIGSLISELPGIKITKATLLFAKSRSLLAGLGHWIGAFLECFWLSLGAVMGTRIVLWITNCGLQDIISLPADPPPPVDWRWQFLVAPILGVCLSIDFGGGGQCDLVGSMAVSCIAIAMSRIGPTYLPDPELGIIVAALITTLAARMRGGRWFQQHCLHLQQRLLFQSGTSSSNENNHDHDHHHHHHHHATAATSTNNAKPKPTLIALLPAFNVLVGGSIGFRGIAYIIAGEEHNGWPLVYQFVIVPCLLVFGVYIGETLIPSSSVL